MATDIDSTDGEASQISGHVPISRSQDEALVAKAYQNPYYRYLVLGILTAVYVSNFVDRQVINVLAQYIIEDLMILDILAVIPFHLDIEDSLLLILKNHYSL